MLFIIINFNFFEILTSNKSLFNLKYCFNITVYKSSITILYKKLTNKKYEIRNKKYM